jgi:hypothetical protein
MFGVGDLAPLLVKPSDDDVEPELLMPELKALGFSRRFA